MRTSTLYNYLLIDNTAVCGSFGMMIKSREFVKFDQYRMGFNGKEKDDEISGEGATYDYGFRIYDSRLGRFLSVDPLFNGYPFYTPYQFAGNNPILNIDLDGLEEVQAAQPETPVNPAIKSVDISKIINEATKKRAEAITAKIDEIISAVSLDTDVKTANIAYITSLISKKLVFDSKGNPIVKTVVDEYGEKTKSVYTVGELLKDAGKDILLDKATEKILVKGFKFTVEVAEKIGLAADVLGYVLMPMNDPAVSSDHVPWPTSPQMAKMAETAAKISKKVDIAIDKVVLGEQLPKVKVDLFKMKETVNDATAVAPR